MKVGQRDLRLELLELKSDTQELTTMLDEMKIKGGGRHSKGASSSDLHAVSSPLFSNCELKNDLVILRQYEACDCEFVNRFVHISIMNRKVW